MALAGAVVGSGALVTPGGAQGPTGATGGSGGTGPAGPTGPSAWTTSTASFTVPNVGFSAVMSVADTSWASVKEYVWVQSTPTVADALQITAKTSTSLTLLNPSTAGTAPSGDAGNLITTGSDSLLYLPPSAIQPTIWQQSRRIFNAIGNPDFGVAQRNARGSVTPSGSSSFVEDRWQGANAGTLNATFQTFLTSLTAGSGVAVPGASQNQIITNSYLRITVGTVKASLASTDSCYLQQNIEGSNFREVSSDAHSLQVLVRSNVANLKFGVGLRDPTGTRSLTKLCTLGAANTITLVSLPNLPVFPSAGTFTQAIGSLGYLFNICVAAGSGNINSANDVWTSSNTIGAVGQDNLFATSGGTFEVFFAQHSPGPYATADTLIDCPFGVNLDGPMGCTRYFQKSYNYSSAPGATGVNGYKAFMAPAATANAWGPLTYPKILPVNGTVTLYNHATGTAASVRDAGSVDHSSATVSNNATTGFPIIGFTTSTTSAMAVYFHYTVDTGW